MKQGVLMTNVYIVNENLSCVGQLNGTLERLFAVAILQLYNLWSN